ncbi:N-acetylglucosamine-6-sulfatase-like [Oscarella lobularis]|uniref:N-acetylglucosamine-6-sulfatase-like n=1 Tax=Oscarella lobularis TaxID=121494 RepID=UPI003313FC03
MTKRKHVPPTTKCLMMAPPSHSYSLLFFVLSSLVVSHNAAEAPPNIVVFMADDQDVFLGGLTPMTQTTKLLMNEGAEFENFFVTTPVCCPSRTATLSGLYAHNLDDQKEGWCGNFASRENNTFALWLQEYGYQTGLFGKYYNSYGSFCNKNIHVPKGWTRWFTMCNDNKFFNNSFNDDGTMVIHGDQPEDYMTSVIGNKSVEWLDKVARMKGVEGSSVPFFAYIAPHAPHVPATPAPWYEHTLPETKAPRTPNWGYHGADHHWVIRQQPEFTDNLIKFSDDLFMRRWRSLLSVDDLVAAVVDVVDKAGQLNNTYFLYTSDHGYNLGQFRLPSGKFQVYDHDIRVPFLIRGPGIKPGSKMTQVASNVDISPTILDLAGVKPRYELDGKSMKPLLSDSDTSVQWRDMMLIEYWGLGYVRRGPCRNGTSPCPNDDALEDAPSNTYSAIRVINSTTNVLYADFRPRQELAAMSSANFSEFYNLLNDPYEMHNLANDHDADVDHYRQLLYQVALCKGTQCP